MIYTSITFVGPYAPKTELPSRKKIFICDPATGPVCVDKILTNLAHHAWRRPVTRLEVVWTAVPAILIVSLCTYAYTVLRSNEDSKRNEMTVNVTARQFAFLSCRVLIR